MPGKLLVLKYLKRVLFLRKIHLSVFADCRTWMKRIASIMFARLIKCVKLRFVIKRQPCSYEVVMNLGKLRNDFVHKINWFLKKSAQTEKRCLCKKSSLPLQQQELRCLLWEQLYIVKMVRSWAEVLKIHPVSSNNHLWVASLNLYLVLWLK